MPVFTPQVKYLVPQVGVEAKYGVKTALEAQAPLAAKYYRGATIWEVMGISQDELLNFENIPIEEMLPAVFDYTAGYWKPRTKDNPPRKVKPFYHFGDGKKEVWVLHPALSRIEFALEADGSTSFVWVAPSKARRPAFELRDHTIPNVVHEEIDSYLETVNAIEAGNIPPGVKASEIKTFLKAVKNGEAPYSAFTNSVDQSQWVRSYEQVKETDGSFTQVIRIEREDAFKKRIKARAEKQKKSSWWEIGLDIFTWGTWRIIKTVLVKLGKWLLKALVWLFDRLKDLWGFMCEALSQPGGTELAGAGASAMTGMPPQETQQGTQVLRDVWCILSGKGARRPDVNFNGSTNLSPWLLWGGVALAGGLLYYMYAKER